jgi:uncharacterized protein (TIGR02145 family)
MKTRSFSLVLSFLLAGLFFVFPCGCKKEKDDKHDDNNNNGQITSIPVLSTVSVTDITQTTATSGGMITSDGGADILARGVCWSTEEPPTTEDYMTIDGTGTGTFTSSLSDLSPGTTYYVRAYATNSAGTGFGNILSFSAEPEITTGSFTDPRDGNVYQTVIIGSQEWMAENLRYLPAVSGPNTGFSTNPHYFVYGYNGTNVAAAKSTANYSIYGVLYNWPAALAGDSVSDTNPSGVRGICPEGWHLPSDGEWTQLTDYLGGLGLAGDKLKEAGTAHWNSPNSGATNETGFTALPGGYRLLNNTFYYMGINGNWWTSSRHSDGNGWHRTMQYNSSQVIRNSHSEMIGLSVRCVRD